MTALDAIIVDELTSSGPPPNSLQSDILKLVEEKGLTDFAKEVGLIDKNNEIEKLKHYDGTMTTSFILAPISNPV